MRKSALHAVRPVSEPSYKGVIFVTPKYAMPHSITGIPLRANRSVLRGLFSLDRIHRMKEPS